MSTVPNIAPMIAAWPPASLLRLAGEPVEPKASPAAALDRLQEELSREMRAVQAEANSLHSVVRKLRGGLGSRELAEVDIESVILKFEDSERRIARDRRLSKIAADLRRDFPRHRRDIRQRFESCLRQLGDFRRLVLKTLRDVRWELMALDALRRGELSGPAFDDPKKLRRYLSKIAH
jgi:hypothetical protein